MPRRRRAALSLIEVMIAISVMAVLAAVIIPQVSDSSQEAKESVLKQNLRAMRVQIDLYTQHHLGVPPDGTSDVKQLWSATNAGGIVGAPGPSFPFGPYLYKSLPPNPITNSTKVTIYNGPGVPPPSGAATAGWLYRPTTGDIWVDDPNYVGW